MRRCVSSLYCHGELNNMNISTLLSLLTYTTTTTITTTIGEGATTTPTSGSCLIGLVFRRCFRLGRVIYWICGAFEACMSLTAKFHYPIWFEAGSNQIA